MNNDRAHFIAFLDHCRRENLVVWADPKLEKDEGRWFGNDHIGVFRKGLLNPISVGPLSTDDQLSKFVDGAPNIKFEVYALLHEYGHWVLKHPNTAPNADFYEQEKQAWDKGEEIGRGLGIKDFSDFYVQRDKSLKSYQVGLGLLGT